MGGRLLGGQEGGVRSLVLGGVQSWEGAQEGGVGGQGGDGGVGGQGGDEGVGGLNWREGGDQEVDGREGVMDYVLLLFI